MNGSILIVDDDDDTAMLLRDSLRKRSFDVECVNSAQKCLERLGGADHQTALSAAWHDPAPRSGVIDVKVLPLQTGVELQAPFATPAPAAVFTRGNAIWAVFAANADLRIDATALPTGYRIRTLRGKNLTLSLMFPPRAWTWRWMR